MISLSLSEFEFEDILTKEIRRSKIRVKVKNIASQRLTQFNEQGKYKNGRFTRQRPPTRKQIEKGVKLKDKEIERIDRTSAERAKQIIDSLKCNDFKEFENVCDIQRNPTSGSCTFKLKENS